MRAVLYTARAESTQATDPQVSVGDRARAVALYLASGDPGRAGEIAVALLPDDG